jgi:hypothetical protein
MSTKARSPRGLLRVERREVLREAFTQPLLVVVLPPDRLSPPLVRELVGQKNSGKFSNDAGSLRHAAFPIDSGFLISAK